MSVLTVEPGMQDANASPWTVARVRAASGELEEVVRPVRL